MTITMQPIVTIKNAKINGYKINYRNRDVIVKKVRSIDHPELCRYPFPSRMNHNCEDSHIVRDANLVPTKNGKEFWDLIQCYSLNVNYDNYGSTEENTEMFCFFSKEDADLAYRELQEAIAMIE